MTSRSAAWLLAALLGERSLAIRLAADSDVNAEDVQADFLKHAMGDAPVSIGKPVAQMQKLNEAYKNAKEVEAKATCDEITTRMVGATAQVKDRLSLLCIDSVCDFSRLSVDEVLFDQGSIAALVSSADGKKCLPQMVGDSRVVEQLNGVLSLVPQLLHAAPTQEGRARVQETYLQLVTWMQGVQALEDKFVDRQKLFGVDALETSCPTPCKKCDFKQSGGFEFRCVLNGKDKRAGKTPQLPGGVTCDAPKRRWLRRWGWKMQCTVNDWKESALQHLHVSAMISCATTTMITGVNSLISETRRRELYRLCLKTEQGNALTEAEESDYQNQVGLVDDVVEQGVKLALHTVLTFGLGYGLAGLRFATRGNERQVALLEGGVPELTLEDFYKPFAAHLVSQEPPHALEVRPLDLWTYGDQTLIQRDETMHRLEVCEYMYTLKSQNTFAEGMAPLVTIGLAEMKQKEASKAVTRTTVDGEVTAADDESEDAEWGIADWTRVILTTAVGTWLAWMWTTVITWVFFLPNLVFGLIPFVNIVLALIQIVFWGFPVWIIYESIWNFLGGVLGLRSAEEKLEQCMADASILGS